MLSLKDSRLTQHAKGMSLHSGYFDTPPPPDGWIKTIVGRLLKRHYYQRVCYTLFGGCAIIPWGWWQGRRVKSVVAPVFNIGNYVVHDAVECATVTNDVLMIPWLPLKNYSLFAAVSFYASFKPPYYDGKTVVMVKILISRSIMPTRF